MDDVKLLLKELKQQHEWRLEQSECGDSEVSESWDRLKYNLESEIKKLKYFNVSLIKLIRES